MAQVKILPALPLFLQPLFGLLTLVDVRQQDVPANNRGVGITQSARTHVEPAVDTVGPARAVVDVVAPVSSDVLHAAIA